MKKLSAKSAGYKKEKTRASCIYFSNAQEAQNQNQLCKRYNVNMLSCDDIHKMFKLCCTIHSLNVVRMNAFYDIDSIFVVGLT
jgi:hypothetical protein